VGRDVWGALFGNYVVKSMHLYGILQSTEIIVTLLLSRDNIPTVMFYLDCLDTIPDLHMQSYT
jgi:hypothetical protein